MQELNPTGLAYQVWMDTGDLEKKLNFRFSHIFPTDGKCWSWCWCEGDVFPVNQSNVHHVLLHDKQWRPSCSLLSTLHQHPCIASTLIPPIPRVLSFPGEWQWATLNGPWRAERPAGRTNRSLSPMRPHVIGWRWRGAAEKAPFCQRGEWRSTLSLSPPAPHLHMPPGQSSNAACFCHTLLQILCLPRI